MSCADATTFEITFEGLSSKGGVCEMPFENPVGANAITVTTFLNNEGSGGQKLGLDSVLSGLRNSPFGVIPSDDKGLIEMSFCRKPLVADWKYGESKNASSLYDVLARIITDQHIVFYSRDEFCPFFVQDCQDETEIQNKCVRSESGSHQDSVMGVPTTHYQTDGSYLYLLTPATTPPSAKNLCRWLSSDEKGSSRNLTGLQSYLPTDWDKSAPEYGSIDDVRPVLPQGSQENLGNHETERKEIVQREGDAVKVQTYSENSQDSSQISGPDGRSKPTPLSQIGFRDPAIGMAIIPVGSGPHRKIILTRNILLKTEDWGGYGRHFPDGDGDGDSPKSLNWGLGRGWGAGTEMVLPYPAPNRPVAIPTLQVQEKSRGDLRPDPRFDAINLISLAIQNDSDSIVEDLCFCTVKLKVLRGFLMEFLSQGVVFL
ncbi:hypothetical protein CerSpe_032160 [Prunus speciosa]